MMKTTRIEFGSLTGTVYDFEVVGDTLPMHTHIDENAHISVVARGSFKAHGDGWQRTLATGNVIDWPPNYAHEFIALEPDSRLVNIIKG